MSEPFSENIKTMINESLQNDIKRFLNERVKWRNAGYTLEILSKIMFATATISSIYSTAIPTWYTSFISAGCGTIGHTLQILSNWSYKEELEVSKNLKITTETIGLKNVVPELKFNEDEKQ